MTTIDTTRSHIIRNPDGSWKAWRQYDVDIVLIVCEPTSPPSEHYTYAFYEMTDRKTGRTNIVWAKDGKGWFVKGDKHFKYLFDAIVECFGPR